jgi:peptidoglycan/LPS O-acetylase OafA/YrhL
VVSVSDAATGEDDDAPARPPLPPTRYYPALDGLRAVAIASVLVYHGFEEGSIATRIGQGGFLGVDIFFVLSGFLITGILLEERERRGAIGLKNFWFRRARRLLPALFVSLLLASLFAHLNPMQRAAVRSDAIFSLLYIQNWHVIWARPPVTPLAPNWSLSVEEQWYIVWPLALALLLKVARHRRRAVLVTTAGLAVLSATSMALTPTDDGIVRVYYSTYTRAFELLIGAVLAILLQHAGPVTHPAARRALGVGGWLCAAFLGVLLLFARTTDIALYRGGLVLVCLATAVVILAVTRTTNALQRSLSLRPLIGLGLISYGVYLFHGPLFAILTPERVDVDGYLLFAVRVAVTIGFATLVYRLLERPIRSGALRTLRGPVLAVCGSFAAIAVLVVSTAWVERLPSATTITRGGIAFYERQRAGSAPNTQRILVAGEANAFMLQNRLGNHFATKDSVGVSFGLFGCGIVLGRVALDTGTFSPQAGCNEWPDAFRRVAAAYQPHVAILMVGDQAIFDRVLDGEIVRPGDEAWNAMFEQQLDMARESLTGTGAQFAVVTSSCGLLPPAGAPFATAEEDPSRIAAVNDVIRNYARTHDGVQTLDLTAAMCPDGRPRQVANGKRLTGAKGGLTDDGARYVWDALVRQLDGEAP